MNEPYQREEQLFADALARPAAERPAFLAMACAGDDALHDRVAALLREHDRPVNFLDRPPERALAEAARADDAAPGVADAPGQKIGRYTLCEKIGEGGCGVVYRAEQTEPVRREVALKIIKLGMDTREVIARFEAERQALALMDHPHIARALDAGATEAGRPFFVMELVRGTKITDYCDEHRLRPEARLRLFAQVCAAVQHAHQKGVIHRDLKPSNILVAAHDGVAVPKVIDFGIAKATQGRLTDRTLFTALDQFIGTPAYMSPEQAEPNAPDVDTRSDLYSLGVLLYELLTGRTPLEAAELRQAGVDEIRRRIREEEPPRPSARLRTLDHATLTQTAACRQIEPPKLVHLVSGDLDWIAMRCLEKDRARRYATANALMLEIERYLAHEPVLARPPSAAYTLGKLIRRHRFGFAAGGAIALALLAGTVVSTRLYLRERAALARAEANERKAQTEAARSAEVARFMQSMLAGVSPMVAQGKDTAMLRQILDETVPRLAELNNQPEVQADLRLTLGQLHLRVAEIGKATELLAAGAEQLRGLPGDHRLKLAETLRHLGEGLQRRTLYREAEKCLREAGAIFQEVQREPTSLRLQTLDQLGQTLLLLNRTAEASAVLQEQLTLARQMPGDNQLEVAIALFANSRVLQVELKYAECEAACREILGYLPVGEKMGDPRLLPNVVLFRLGTVVWLQSRMVPARRAEAEALLRESLAFERRFLPSSPSTETMNVLATVVAEQGRYDEAIVLNRETLALKRIRLQKDPSNRNAALSLVNSLKNIGHMLARQEQLAEAEAALAEAETITQQPPGGPRDVLIEVLLIHGEILVRLQRLAEAERCMIEALPLEEEKPDWHIYRLAQGLHQSLSPQGKIAEVEAAWTRLMTCSREIKNLDSDTEFTTGLISAMVQMGRPAQAESFARENLARWERHAPDDWRVFAFRTQAGLALLAQGKYAEAEPLLLTGAAGLRERSHRLSTQNHETLRLPYLNLIRLYNAWGKWSQAAEWKRQQDELVAGAKR